MKYICLTILCIAVLCGRINAQLNTPLLISGKVYNSKGEVISTESLHFRVFPEGKAAHYLDQDAASCGYQPPLWFAELGNLPVPWAFGDKLIIIIEDIENRENIRFSWVIDSTAGVPQVQTQPLYQNDLITEFRLSDRGVFHKEALKFHFRSLFSELPAVELKIFSQAGREVFKTDKAQAIDSDLYQFSWDGRSSKGQALRSGMYYYVLNVDRKLLHSGIITLKNE